MLLSFHWGWTHDRAAAHERDTGTAGPDRAVADGVRIAGHDRGGYGGRDGPRHGELHERVGLGERFLHGRHRRSQRPLLRRHRLLGTVGRHRLLPGRTELQDPSVLASSLKELNSTWTDQGCKTALAGFGDYVTAQQKSVLRAVATIPASVQKIHIGAQQTKQPGAADAMNKMATDMQTIFTRRSRARPRTTAR